MRMQIRNNGFLFTTEYTPMHENNFKNKAGQKEIPDDPEELEIIGAEIETAWKVLEFLEDALYHELLASARDQYLKTYKQ